MRVLVTDAQQKQALTVTQSLGRQGVEVSLVDSSPNAMAFASQYCCERFVSPPLTNQEAYTKFLLDIVKRQYYDLLVTCTDMTTWYLSCAREDFADHVRLILPDRDTFETVAHKDRLMQFAKQHAIPVPQTFFPTNMDEVRQYAAHLPSPIVIKAVRGAGACQVRFASHDTITQAVEGVLKGGLLHNPRWPILQEYLPGEDIMVYALCDRGQLLAMLPWKFARCYPVSGGNAGRAIVIRNDEIERLAARLVELTGWHGIAGIEFRWNPQDSRCALLEINVRFGARTQVAIAAGLDLPYLYWKHFVEREAIIPPDFRVGTIHQSLFPDDVLHLLAHPRCLGAIVSDLCNWRVDHGFRHVPLRVIARQMASTWRAIRLRHPYRSLREADAVMRAVTLSVLGPSRWSH